VLTAQGLAAITAHEVLETLSARRAATAGLPTASARRLVRVVPTAKPPVFVRAGLPVDGALWGQAENVGTEEVIDRVAVLIAGDFVGKIPAHGAPAAARR